jgi:hypothetical protein
LFLVYIVIADLPCRKAETIPNAPWGSGIAVFHYSAKFFNRGRFGERNISFVVVPQPLSRLA